MSQWKRLALAKSVASSPVVRKENIWTQSVQLGGHDAHYNCSGVFYYPSKRENKVSAEIRMGEETWRRENKEENSLWEMASGELEICSIIVNY